MSSITLDQGTVDRLRKLGAPVELRDPQGEIIGFFRPPPRTYQQGEMPEISEEELARRFSESQRLTTEDVLRRLEEPR
jgi:hypothetical protein